MLLNRNARSLDPCLATGDTGRIDHFQPNTTYQLDLIDQLASIGQEIKTLGEHPNTINKRLVSPYEKVKLTNEPTVGPVPDRPTAIADEPPC